MIAPDVRSAVAGSAADPLQPSRPQTARPTKHDRLTVDAPTRVFHWLFAGCFLGAYASGDGDNWRAVHIALGYMMIALIGFRVLYGLVGPRSLRLGALFRRAMGWSLWFGSFKPENRNEYRAPQLHSLFTASIVLSLVGFALLVFITGYATHYEWGGSIGTQVFEALHELFANGFMLAAAVHIAGVALLSVLRLRNLALPMMTGRSPGTGPNLVKHNHAWLAWALALGICSFGIWQWAHLARA